MKIFVETTIAKSATAAIPTTEALTTVASTSEIVTTGGEQSTR
jgi:hypothetical protein